MKVICRCLPFFVILITPSALIGQDWIPKRVVGMEYPVAAVQASIQPTFELECTLNSRGTVGTIEILRVQTALQSGPTGQILLNATRENMKKWIFMKKEAMASPSPSKIKMRYIFKIEGEPKVTPHQEFIYEYPDTVKITSEPLKASR